MSLQSAGNGGQRGIERHGWSSLTRASHSLFTLEARERECIVHIQDSRSGRTRVEQQRDSGEPETHSSALACTVSPWKSKPAERRCLSAKAFCGTLLLRFAPRFAYASHSVVNAFRWYERDACAEIARWEYNYSLLSSRHKCGPDYSRRVADY